MSARAVCMSVLACCEYVSAHVCVRACGCALLSPCIKCAAHLPAHAVQIEEEAEGLPELEERLSHPRMLGGRQSSSGQWGPHPRQTMSGGMMDSRLGLGPGRPLGGRLSASKEEDEFDF